MKMKKCGCRYCRGGMRTRQNSKLLTKLTRAARHKAKQDLKQGKEPDTTFYVPYTD